LLVAALGVSCDRSKPDETTSAVSASVPAKPKIPPLPAPPKGLPAPPSPKDNPTTDEKVLIGRQLFFDKRMSPDGKRACDSCHGPPGTSPAADAAKPVGPTATSPRDPPLLVNLAYADDFFWDGRERSLEKAVRAEWAQLGATAEKIAERARSLAKVPSYMGAFKRVFGEPGVTPEAVTMAIAAFLRTLTCADTPFDRFRSGDQNALTPQQQKGLQLFEGKAACASCHPPPFLSDAFGAEAGFHNVGAGTREAQREGIDKGRAAITHADADWAAFRTPSLRNVTKTGPYWHDGSEPTLDAAVIAMARGGRQNPNLSKELKDHKLAPHELQALIDFMPALECKVELGRPALPPDAQH
jgi:cytochrome c peroxidase